MTRIDFYILPDAAPAGRERLACRLADKAYRLGHRVYIYSATREQVQALDDLLWTFQSGSFVPHELHPSPVEAPVLIGHDGTPETLHDVLINLHDTVPPFFSRYTRVAEIIAQDDAGKRAGRERFRFYRDRGYALETHTLTAQTEDA